MAFTLPELPYDMTALEPYLSAETFEYHYGKHHKTYVDTLNGMIEGTDEENGKSLEDIIIRRRARSSTRRPRSGTTTCTGTRWRPAAAGRRRAPPATPSTRRSAAYDKFRDEFKTAATGQFGSGWAWLTLDGGKLGDHRRPATPTCR